MSKNNSAKLKKNDRARQTDIETALVIGGAAFIILIIVFLIAVFNVYTADCSEYVSDFINALG